MGNDLSSAANRITAAPPDFYRVPFIIGDSEATGALVNPSSRAMPWTDFKRSVADFGLSRYDATKLGFRNDATGAAGNKTALQGYFTNGGFLFFPPGTYDFSTMDGLTLVASTLVIRGIPGKTVFKVPAAAKLFPIGSGDLDMEGIRFVGPQTSETGSIVNLEAMTADVDLVRVRQCEFFECFTGIRSSTAVTHSFTLGRLELTANRWERGSVNGIGFCRTSACRIDSALVADNWISGGIYCGIAIGYYPNDGSGLVTGDVNRVQIERNVVRDIQPPSDPGSEGAYGIVTNSNECIVTGNHVQGVYPGFGTSPVANIEGIYLKCRNGVIANNQVVNCGGNQGMIAVKGVGSSHPPSMADQRGTVVTGNIVHNVSQSGVFANSTGFWIQGDQVVLGNNLCKGMAKSAFRVNPTDYRSILIANNLVRDHYGDAVVRTPANNTGFTIDGLLVDGWFTTVSAPTLVAFESATTSLRATISGVEVLERFTQGMTVPEFVRIAPNSGTVDILVENCRTAMPFKSIIEKRGSHSTGTRAIVRACDLKNFDAVWSLNAGATDIAEKIETANYGTLG